MLAKDVDVFTNKELRQHSENSLPAYYTDITTVFFDFRSKIINWIYPDPTLGAVRYPFLLYLLSTNERLEKLPQSETSLVILMNKRV